MAATVSLIDGLIAKVKGLPEPKPQAPAAPLENGSRTYTVSDWMPTCSKCGRKACGEEPRECGQSSWFPIFHMVVLVIRNGVVTQATCREGKKLDGVPCAKVPCKHIDRVKTALAGGKSKGVDISMMSTLAEQMPKCPNCREKWGVISQTGDYFECRNPVCVRDERSWRFKKGDTARPSPMRHELVVRDREPGRVVRKRQTTKMWGAL
jgi:hypothetical protein